MKKIIIATSLFLALTVGFSKASLAASDFYHPSILPTSPWYQLKTIKERLELFFTLSSEKKVETLSTQAGRRLAEARYLIGDANKAAVQKQLGTYLDTYNRAFSEANKINTASGQQTAFENIANNTNEELQTLGEAYKASSDETVKKSLAELMAVVSKNQSNLVATITGEVKKAIITKIEAGRVSELTNLIPSKIIGN